MRKFTILLLALIASAFALEVNAGPTKAPARSGVFNYLPDGFQQVGGTSIYYDVSNRTAPGPGSQTGYSIIGEIEGKYYSSTYERNDTTKNLWGTITGIDYREGAGFIAALKVNNANATYFNAASGTTSAGVRMTSRIEPHGDVAALITYTLHNTNNADVTISAGVWGDIMIGDNDFAPLERLVHEGDTYGLKLKYRNTPNTPLMCVLFGEGVTGVTPADDFWFGFYRNNYEAAEIIGNYDNHYEEVHSILGYTWTTEELDPHYMQENGNYDSGMGFCWKDRIIPAGETIELSYLISVGEIEYEEPFVPGDDRFEYKVEAFDFEGWNDLSVAHPAHVFGYYEHPYGQNGYIEYQVDGMRSWTRIPTQLTSGENFDLPFDMFFNEDITTTHVLELRFNDGLDNITPMTGLSWTDVRSIPVSGLEDRAYTGEPQTYEVTVGGGEPFIIGENGEYVEPGDYTYGIEGDFDENTIGINEVGFSITVGQTIIRVTVPENCLYDGNEHPATAQMIVGDGQIVVTYVNTATGEVSENAPVEPGTYDVYAEVVGSVNYNDVANTYYGTFTIDKLPSKIDFTIPEDCVYDGNAHAATATLVEGDGILTITYVDENGVASEEAPVEPGTYVVVVTVTETNHYYGLDETVGSFTIDKAQSKIEYTIPDDVIFDDKPHGATVTLVEGDGVLTVTYKNTTTGEILTEAPTQVGNYDVIVVVTETDHYYGISQTTIGNFSILSKHTGINEMTVDSEDNGEWYTIDGRRVAAPSKGVIYIHNGKKILVK